MSYHIDESGAADFARQLERELAQTREKLAKLQAEKEAGQFTAIADVYAKACLERTEKAESGRDAAVKVLAKLVAVVRGECPGLLNEDSGGDAQLSAEIDEVIPGTNDALSRIKIRPIDAAKGER